MLFYSSGVWRHHDTDWCLLSCEQSQRIGGEHRGWLWGLSPQWTLLSLLSTCPIFYSSLCQSCNTLRPRQNGRHFPDNIFKCIFLNESIWIAIEISLKFVPKGPINNIPALVQIMAWHRPGDKPLSEPMLVCLLTHICVTRPQWVKEQVPMNEYHRAVLFL